MLKRTLFHFILIVIISSFGAVVMAQDTINVGDTVEGTASEADVSYALKLAEGQAIEISLTAEDFDTLVRINDSSGTELASDDDGGDFFNSLLAYTAPTSDTYTVVVSSFGGAPSGAFTLSITEVGAADDGGTDAGAADGEAVAAGECGGSSLNYGCTLTVEPAGADQTVLTFSGNAGDAVDISATSLSEDGEDGELVLFTPGGREVARNDDGGEGLNPLIKRYLLPESGDYTLELVQAFGDPLNETFEVSLEQTESLVLGDGELTVSMGEDIDYEVLTFNVERGVTYVVTVNAGDGVDNSLFADFLEEGDTFADTRFSVSSFSEFSITFSPEQTGTIRVELDYFSFSETVDFVFTVTQN